MTKGLSLHIGVNKLDHDHYVGMSDLEFCEADAKAMQKIARAQNFKTRSLLGSRATRKNVSRGIELAAEKLDTGDIFLITYAGHGCYIPDTNKDEREVKGHKFDRKDETWCLYDAQQVDDERGVLWGNFKKGVRICVLSDSCHSGTTVRGGRSAPAPSPTFRKRSADKSAADATYEKHQAFYDGLQRTVPKKFAADLLLISGCQDHEESGETSDFGHGNFTYALKEIWAQGEFDGTYKDLWKAVKAEMPGFQTPNMFPTKSKLARERPFEIG